MDNKQIGLIIAAVLVLWYYTMKARAAKALMLRYLLPKNVRISKGAVMWDQPVVITNPTGTPLGVNRYYIQISLEGYPIGTAFENLYVKLIAGGDTTILAKVVVPIDGLISAVPSLLSAGSQLDFRLVGNVVAEGITAPVDTTIKVPIPKLFK